MILSQTEPGTYTYCWVLDKEDNLPRRTETNNVIEGTIVVAERSAEHDRLQAALLDQLELIGQNMVEGRYPPELELGPDSTHKELQCLQSCSTTSGLKCTQGTNLLTT